MYSDNQMTEMAGARPGTTRQSANPMGVLLMMYDGSISYLQKAVEHAKTGNTQKKNLYINKARDIIEEFNNSLDVDSGGEIARCLKSLYFFMDRHLAQSAWTTDTSAMTHVMDMLSNLRESWQFASDSLVDEKSVGPAAQH